jgi:hypothetical protein
VTSYQPRTAAITPGRSSKSAGISNLLPKQIPMEDFLILNSRHDLLEIFSLCRVYISLDTIKNYK